MGTSDSYSGGGGAAGNKLRDEVDEWLDSLPNTPPPDQDDGDDGGDHPDNADDRPKLPHESLLNVLPLLRPFAGGGRGADGPGGGGGAGGGRDGAAAGRGGTTGGAQRSARASASVAGRAAAAAYALRVGDAETLERMGLDLQSLRANDDPIDVARQIVNAACESALSDGTIEDDERRYVASEVTNWVLEENEGGAPPTPEEIVQKSIAVIISEAAQNETVERIRRGERPEWASLEAERQLREAAEVLARRVEVSPEGMTDEDFARAVEEGIETLRRIRGDG